MLNESSKIQGPKKQVQIQKLQKGLGEIERPKPGKKVLHQSKTIDPLLPFLEKLQIRENPKLAGVAQNLCLKNSILKVNKFNENHFSIIWVDVKTDRN